MEDLSFAKITENITEIFKHPTSLAALLGVILLIGFLMKTRKVKLDVRIITQIGLALALATVLKIFRLYHFPQGGSITLGSMIPILLISLFYGPETGFLTGFLYGIITLLLDPYVLHPVQVLFDYPLPFMVLGLAGYFKENKILGTVAAVFARFLCHFISGYVFFGSYAPQGTSPFVYSLMVNGIHMGVEGIICVVIMVLLPVPTLYSILNRKKRIA
jgi:thiamine transporter